MDISSYLTPVDVDSLELVESSEDPHLLFNYVQFYDGADFDWEKMQIAIVGVPESRGAFNNMDTRLAPDEIRKQLYRLYRWKPDVEIIDLGNVIVGNTVEDTYEVVSELMALLINENIIPIILGGGNDLAYANYLAYDKLQQFVSIVNIDSRFDLGMEEEPLRSNAYLNKIILRQPNFLLNCSNIGYQTYMNSPESIEMMDKLFFEAYRVGNARQDLPDMEPVIRNADMLSIDIGCVRHPDAPGNPNASANGFYGEEICQLVQYAGLNDKLTSFGIYEYDPMLDYNGQTAMLISHMVWYFVEGYLKRQDDLTFKDKNNYTRITQSLTETLEPLVFYCSKKTSRWWVEVPIINCEKQTQQTYFLPCSINDYKMAEEDVVPERWWKAFNKFNQQKSI